MPVGGCCSVGSEFRNEVQKCSFGDNACTDLQQLTILKQMDWMGDITKPSLTQSKFKAPEVDKMKTFQKSSMPTIPQYSNDHCDP